MECVLVTGGAGFIGYHLSLRLLAEGYTVIGFDNLNDYYDPRLKQARLDGLSEKAGYTFVRGDLADREAVENLFITYTPSRVVNLGAQAGVRYSIEHPDAYIQSNLIGFYHVLECCRAHPVSHLVYASSSSVYGMNDKVPFSVDDKTDAPVSLYAATKKSNELLAYSYSNLHQIPATGLRFFTVYGPMGRPDMAYFKFAEKIMTGQLIQIYNNGDMYRDFTYVDDITEGILRVLRRAPSPDKHNVPHKVYNIGGGTPEKLMDFIHILEHALGVTAKKEFLPMQAGDVYRTFADTSALEQDFGFKPTIGIQDGLLSFAKWYKEWKAYGL